MEDSNIHAGVNSWSVLGSVSTCESVHDDGKVGSAPSEYRAGDEPSASVA